MAGTAAAAAAAPLRSRLRYGKDAAGKEILIMVTAGEVEEEEAGAAPTQETAGGDEEAQGTAIAPRTATAAAAAKPYQGTNTIVMMEWEKEYMETLVEALGITEDDEVLEIGWGLGYSATAIQKHRPRRHVIVECDTGVLARAEAWKKTVLEQEQEEEEEGQEKKEGGEGTAAAAAADDGDADGPAESNKSSSSRKGERQRREEKKTTKRSIDLVQGYWQQALPSMGQFTAVLMDDFPLPLEEGPGGAAGEDEARVLASTGGSRWHHFLDLIVSHHLHPGGRITGYLARDLDLGRADCLYTRRSVHVMVPSNCTYATPGRQTYYVPLVTKKEEGRGGGGGGGGGGGMVGCTHFITGRARGDGEITAQDQGEEGVEGLGEVVELKSKKRRRMVAYVLEAQEQGGGDGEGYE